MATQTLSQGTKTTLIDTGAVLADGSLAEATITTTDVVGKLLVDLHLTVQFNTTAPTAGDAIANVYFLPGDNDTGTVRYAEGGSALVPQAALLVATFETRDPSTSVDEVLTVPSVPLPAGQFKVLIENVSGQEFDATYQLDGTPIIVTIA